MRATLALLSALLFFSAAAFAEEPPAGQPAGGALAGERFRVIISTDIGGSDPDDFQSMVHPLVYADGFDTEGLISSPPGRGRAKDIHATIDCYEKDYPNLSTWSEKYPTPGALRTLVKQGATDPAPPAGFSQPTEGSRWLIRQARLDDPRPLYVLVWGSITDVAQALHDAPDIKKKIRVYFISSWNRRMDPASRDYIYNNHKNLWLIEADTTFRGMYAGGNQKDDLGNISFVQEHVKGHGALGDFFFKKKRDIKMGDTPSVLYLMRGNPDDPGSDHWGGRFVKTGHGPNYWTDDPAPEAADAGRAGARHVSRWREAYLRDWQARMKRIVAAKPRSDAAGPDPKPPQGGRSLQAGRSRGHRETAVAPAVEGAVHRRADAPHPTARSAAESSRGSPSGGAR